MTDTSLIIVPSLLASQKMRRASRIACEGQERGEGKRRGSGREILLKGLRGIHAPE